MIFLFFFQAAEAFLVRLFEDAYHSACLHPPYLIFFCCVLLTCHTLRACVQFYTNRVLAEGFSMHVPTHGKHRREVHIGKLNHSSNWNEVCSRCSSSIGVITVLSGLMCKQGNRVILCVPATNMLTLLHRFCAFWTKEYTMAGSTAITSIHAVVKFLLLCTKSNTPNCFMGRHLEVTGLENGKCVFNMEL